MDVSNIDDLLMGGGNATQPETPEAYAQDLHTEEPQVVKETPEFEAPEADAPEADAPETDDYGNEKPKPRMYTEEEHRELVNKAIRERFERFNRNNPEVQAAQKQTHEQAQGFEYDESAPGDLQEQLDEYLEQAFQRMQQKRQSQELRLREQAAQAQFEERFAQGMQRFHDFRDVMTSLPCEISDPMVHATRAMDDPAAFLYAAAKRHPQELERIARISDPYAQIAEMGKLDERMRRTQGSTQAPRPLGKPKEDVVRTPPKQSQKPEIEDLIAQNDAKRLARLRRSRGR